MKFIHKIVSFKTGCSSLLMILLSNSVFAADRLASALGGDVQDMLGGSGTFWKIFILVDIVLAAAAAVKTKNPMVFAGVFAIAFLPALILNAFVFHGA
jgi:hypothetical protein